MVGVDFVITWNKEIPRLMTQMFMLVICCFWVIGIYSLGQLLHLMLSIHQNTWWWVSNAEGSCLRQSSSWGRSVTDPGGIPHALGSKHGHLSCPLPGSIWELWMTHQCPSAKHRSSHQLLCRHFISAVALTCWCTRQAECLHFSTLLSVTSPRESFSCRFQLCPPGRTWLPSRGVVGKTWDVKFAWPWFSGVGANIVLLCLKAQAELC